MNKEEKTLKALTKYLTELADADTTSEEAKEYWTKKELIEVKAQKSLAETLLVIFRLSDYSK